MFVVWDGVDGDYAFFDTEEEAVIHLKNLIEDGLDDGEWMDDVEYSFIAEITHIVKKKKGIISKDGRQYFEMNIEGNK